VTPNVYTTEEDVEKLVKGIKKIAGV
jgi:selenocysteine lyase/cysteine desulfurase